MSSFCTVMWGLELMCVQFLESYKSVTLQSMADAFGISVDFLDEEIADFIVDGRLPAKIDRVAGVIETKRWGPRPPTPPSNFCFARQRTGSWLDLTFMTSLQTEESQWVL